MNVLFLSISSLPHISEHSISLDLIHEFQRNGHKVFVVCAIEKRDNGILASERCRALTEYLRTTNNGEINPFSA